MIRTEEAIHVRSARSSDRQAIVEFNAAMALETEEKILDPDVLAAGVAAVFDEPGRGFYLVAESDGAIAGCLMITFEWSDWRNGNWWWLQSVYIDPNFRRRGVFRALYAEIERRAGITPGVVGVRLYVERDNTRAQQTYASLGMHETKYRMYEKTLRGGSRALRQP
jgi:GNAT superfamily N-acetyltransferase